MNIYTSLGAIFFLLGVILFGFSGVKRLRKQGNMTLLGLALVCCVCAAVLFLNGVNPS